MNRKYISASDSSLSLSLSSSPSAFSTASTMTSKDMRDYLQLQKLYENTPWTEAMDQQLLLSTLIAKDSLDSQSGWEAFANNFNHTMDTLGFSRQPVVAMNKRLNKLRYALYKLSTEWTLHRSARDLFITHGFHIKSLVPEDESTKSSGSKRSWVVALGEPAPSNENDELIKIAVARAKDVGYDEEKMAYIMARATMDDLKKIKCTPGSFILHALYKIIKEKSSRKSGENIKKDTKRR